MTTLQQIRSSTGCYVWLNLDGGVGHQGLTPELLELARLRKSELIEDLELEAAFGKWVGLPPGPKLTPEQEARAMKLSAKLRDYDLTLPSDIAVFRDRAVGILDIWIDSGTVPDKSEARLVDLCAKVDAGLDRCLLLQGQALEERLAELGFAGSREQKALAANKAFEEELFK